MPHSLPQRSSDIPTPHCAGVQEPRRTRPSLDVQCCAILEGRGTQAPASIHSSRYVWNVGGWDQGSYYQAAPTRVTGLKLLLPGSQSVKKLAKNKDKGCPIRFCHCERTKGPRTRTVKVPNKEVSSKRCKEGIFPGQSRGTLLSQDLTKTSCPASLAPAHAPSPLPG